MGVLWGRSGRASGLMLTSAAVLFVSVVWFAVNLVRPVGPQVLLWLPTPIGAVVLTAVFRRTARTAELSEPTRRFWRHLSYAVVLVGIAATSQAVDMLLHPGRDDDYNGPVLLVLDTIAIAVIVYALYRLPFGSLTPGERLRVALDGGTVVAGAAVFIWHFQTSRAEGGSAVVASLVLTVLSLTVVLAVAKFVLSGYEFIDRSALRWLAFAIFFGATSPLVQPLLDSGHPHLLHTQYSIPAVFCFGAWAGERQRRAATEPRRRVGADERRPFSYVPYGAVVAVDVLLIFETWYGDHTDLRVVVAGAVALTTLVVIRQITAFRDNGRLLARLDHNATHDALTQLPNRVLFGERLQKALAAPGSHPVAVALIDLDDFKEVNDTLGHEVGDQLLIAVAQRLGGCVRAGDTVARLGGDEFVVVLDGADPAAADLAAERMIAALDRPVVVDGHELPIRASIGIADGRTGDESSVLLRQADIAMYAAKKVPGTVRLHYDCGMTAVLVDGGQLRAAIDGDHLRVHFQPIVPLGGGRPTGVEALVRWQHPEHGLLTPDVFLPAAERTGLIVPIGRWVLRTACHRFAEWTLTHGTAAPASLHVNVSARELREPDFAGFVAATLAESGVAAERLVVEIAETELMQAPAPLTAVLADLKALGTRISLDDFGIGTASLTLLHEYPFDEVKLDRSITRTAVDGRPSMAATVLQLARALDLHAVAVGVEQARQADRLWSLGYPAAQGYLFARPLPAEELAVWLTACAQVPITA
ncbi:bifunctional diguanylate cyclase/phosphodiesterase [Dactylosporangium fulvum]|uniref:Bifunctional diguanylate cyclase/phosphodiesterase n=1 Tax=Dactylosporangium fulvum TaxID=53359 RepID=A0ABY5WBF8_9ACTN|nr:bifunctional diguanylate cyclase/phosphodiesterase [Dactylosporangium fulvum]UWP86446.1 bifunctional diguanylate cyclase/phosphodiesterase [Dactylosporangium fulvum]